MRQLLQLLWLVGLTAPATSACSCFGAKPVCSSFWTTPVVFHGRIVERKLIPNLMEVKRPDGSTVQLHGDGTYEVRFAVEEMFRGDMQTREITIRTSEQSSACGFDFKDDGDYLVYAYTDKESGELWTTHCERTHEVVSPDDDDLTWIRSVPTLPPTGRVFGTLRFPAGAEGGAVRVTLSGPETRSTTVDALGAFQVDGLKPGQYTLAAALPPGLQSVGPRAADVQPKGCAEINLWLRFDSYVRGRVTDSEGKPLAKLQVSGVTAAAGPPGVGQRLASVTTDEQGRFSFDEVTPGVYFLAVNYDGATRSRPYPRTFYGGGETLTGAAALDLTTPRKIEDVNITLPSPLQPRSVAVRALLPDGKPADHPDVLVYSAEPPYSIVVSDSLNRDGEGSVTVFRDRVYFFVATLPAEKRCGGAVRFVASEGAATPTVVINQDWPECVAHFEAASGSQH